jgi:hypothetical protein
MAVEFKVTVQDTPGTLRLGAILGEAGVNIEASQGTSREGKGFIQFVPSHEERPPAPSNTGRSDSAVERGRHLCPEVPRGAVRLVPVALS